MVPLLPFPPRPSLASSGTQGQNKAFRMERRVWEKTCDTVLALKMLYRGKLVEEDFGRAEEIASGRHVPSVPLGRPWTDCSAELKGLVYRIEAAWRRLKPEPGGPRGEAALVQLTGAQESSLGGPRLAKQRGFSRGDVMSMEVAAVDVPDLGAPPIRASLLSPRLAAVFCDPEMRMLREPEEARRRQAGVRSFEDPILKDPFQRLLLARRLWYGWMLGSTDQMLGSVSFFAVVKKLVSLDQQTTQKREKGRRTEKGLRGLWQRGVVSSRRGSGASGNVPSTARSGSGRRGPSSGGRKKPDDPVPIPIPSGREPQRQGAGSSSRPSCLSAASGWTTPLATPKHGAILRLVIDERWENEKWEDPPKAELSSPESISNLDCSPGSLQGGAVAMWKGDIPHY